MAFAALSLKGRALRLLSQREHSRFELEKKLRAHADSADELSAMLDDLAVKGFISEARVVSSVVRRRAERLGAARIRQELQGKGIAPEAVAQAIASLQSSEVARAHDLWSRKFDAAPPTEPKERARQMRFLLTRGFGGDTVRKVLAGRGREDEDGIASRGWERDFESGDGSGSLL